MFNRLIWQHDRMLLDELVFRLHPVRNDDWELGDDCFAFEKPQSLVDQYESFWSGRRFQPQNVFEIGIFGGGSVAFWFELFHPNKHVAIDISRRADSRYFKRFVASRGLEDTIRTYWKTDQGDSRRLIEIVEENFNAPLDLVIDDASHLYGLTKQSFEALFPRLRPGGFYIIEDWAWAHAKQFHSPDHPWAGELPLTKLVFDLVEVVGSSNVIESLTVFSGFAVVERGRTDLSSAAEFGLEASISRRPERAGSPRVQAAIDEILPLIAHGESFVLVDQGDWATEDVVAGREVMRWDSPADDETAMLELSGLRRDGAAFLVFGWPAFWWLDYYSGLHRHLRSTFRCILQTDQVVVFDLRSEGRYSDG